jgi:3-methylcrotonyl-CoA carboxylase alpha subunit
MTVLGPATIRPFLVDALREPVFGRGEATTLFIGETWPEGWKPRAGAARERDALAAAIWLAGTRPKASGPWGALTDFRLLGTAGKPAASHLSLSHAGQACRVAVENTGSSFRVIAKGGDQDICVAAGTDPTRWPVMLDGRRLTIDAVRDEAGVSLRWGSFEGHIAVALAVAAEAAAREAAGSAGDSVRATMPGTIAAIHVQEGDSVAAGQVVAVLESMKLFMDLKSPAAGTVARVAAKPGATAAAGELLIAITPD